MSNTYLSRTLSGSSSREQWTFSAWVKISGNPTGSYGYLFSCTDAANHTARISIMNNNVAKFGFVDSLISTDVQTNRLLRDNNSWYHLMVVLDTTLGTSSDRVKLYVNGVRETSLANTTYPSVNAGGLINYKGGSYVHNIGSYNGSSNFFNGCMSHVHFADGAMLAPSVFGETDIDTGEWKIKVDPTFTPGTNGFSILMDGNTITDQSANSNNWSSNGAGVTKTLDNPSSVMCTLNPLWTQESTRVPTLTYGNTMFSGGSSSTWYQTIGTLGFSSGKYYWEAKYNAGTNLGKNLVGVVGIDGMSSGKFYEKTPSFFYKNEDGGEYRMNNVQSNLNCGTLAQNDILGFSIDMDASPPTARAYKNGTALFGNIDLTSFAGKTIVPAVSTYSSGEFQMNFGNGYFGTSAITTNSGNGYAGAEGASKFNYQPPTGYSALNTKGLNT